MKVLHFSADNSNNGAGLAATRIHRGLLQRGVASRFCAHFMTQPLDQCFAPPVSFTRSVQLKATRTVDGRLARRAVRSDAPVLTSGLVGHDMGRVIATEAPDIAHLHWIGGGSFRLTSLAGTRVPIVWRLADMWPFCALDHYTDDPGRYAVAIEAAPRTAYEALAWRAKKRTYAAIASLVVACPSSWIASEARRSELLGDRPIVVVPTGCDTALFKPRDKAQCRAMLDLAPDERIILVGAADLTSVWKGSDLALEALQRMAADGSGRGARIVSFGFSALDLGGGPRLPLTHIGTIVDRRLMSIVYGAADVFVAPSRMENLANTVLEALSCGTPVVGFDIGGMPDAIEHQVNGYLARPFDTADLARGIAWVLDSPAADAVSAAARSKIVSGFSLEQEIASYVRIYEQLLQPVGEPEACRTLRPAS